MIFNYQFDGSDILKIKCLAAEEVKGNWNIILYLFSNGD